MRYGIDRMILWGTIISTTAASQPRYLLHLAGLAQPGWCSSASMVPLGFGNGLVLPNATAGTLSVRPRLAGSASGLGGALMIGGGAALSAYAGTLLSADSGAEPLIALDADLERPVVLWRSCWSCAAMPGSADCQ